ncbi:MAG: GNAT family N-acetyltransferase [Novosphingobium sp.]
MVGFRLETERVVLRSWREDDMTVFHAINSDPAVMATLGPVMSKVEVSALIERMQAIEAEHGHCCWAMERREDARLIGWCGVIRGKVGPIVGKAEIGWRMARDCWGQGLVSEAARASVDWFFANRPDPSVWAITSTDNHRSRAVMERLGMAYQPGLDFDHPKLAADSRLLRHVTYELPRHALRSA